MAAGAESPERQFRLRPGVRLAPAGEGRWQARWDFDRVTFLEGAACIAVLPWLVPRLAHTASRSELLADPECPCGAAELERVLETLLDQGFVEQEPEGGALPAGAAVGLRGADLDRVRERFGRVAITIAAEPVFGRQIRDALEAMGVESPRIQVTPDIDTLLRDEITFPVVSQTALSRIQLETVNTRSIARCRPWLLVGVWDSRVLVGPLFVPGETACHACYRARLDGHRAHLEAHRALEAWECDSSAPPVSPAAPPILSGLAACWTAQEAFAFLSGAQPVHTAGRVLVYYPEDVRISIEAVLRVPWCAACGTA